VRPIPVQTGLSDGTLTEIVKGDLKEGTAVVVGDQTRPPEKKGERPPEEGKTLLIQRDPLASLTVQDAEAIARDCSEVRDVAPLVRARTQVIHGDRNWTPIHVYGTTPSFLEVRDWADLAEGKAFTDRDVLEGAKVCLVGQTLVKEL